MGKAHLDEMKNGDKLASQAWSRGNTTFSTNVLTVEVNRVMNSIASVFTQSEDETDQLTYWFLTKSIPAVLTKTSIS